MPTIKEVKAAILNRENDIKDDTKEKYVRKFENIIKGCNDNNFLDRFNDTEYIINVYLKEKKPRTIITYIGDIMAINGSIRLLTPENLKKLTDYRDIQKNIVEEAKEQKEIIEKKQETFTIREPEVFDTESETSSDDYGHYCIEEPEEVVDTLKEKKIAIQYEIEKLEQRLIKLRNTLDILDEI